MIVSNSNQETTRSAFSWRKRGLVSYGVPFPQLVATHVERLGKLRVYTLVSWSLARNTDTVSRLKEALGPKLVGERIGFPSHVPWNDLLRLAQEINESAAELVVTVGGGSITDAVKLAGLILANDLHDFKALDAMSSRLKAAMQHDIDYKHASDPQDVNPPPFVRINVPTTLSAGEYSPYAGGIDPTEGVKKIFILQSLACDIVILDPELARHSPEWVWMSSGVRSIDHCVELLGSLSKIDPETEDAAEKGLVLVARGLLKLRNDPSDLQARLETQLGSNFAMDGKFTHHPRDFYESSLISWHLGLCRGVHLGGSHAIGHQLGTMNVAHGYTSCILCPSVMKCNAKVNAARQQRAIDILWSDSYIRQALSKRGLTAQNDLGDLLDGLFREYGMPRTLKEVGVEGEANLQTLAVRSLKDPWCRTNPIPLTTLEQVINILNTVEI
ncbi:uncharacterized protein A1O5_10049 [Cladophialophora psammophila CBS 110553]|uniref:Uncharacterized protein n=1 Tax=Cladophialophora psammophila CBS 110553 TaxID=1182543 RepID=W9X8U9_9EURO|nr:uncharacterized protein A1O5_10049 [Cladophialophora psammophila CBS 110553]EXJ66854.1 hypothetical protein A1O5_10049 [Cladophialophora psammophila CBS 110553]